jgi:EAL domain-containing protein (putative c-di-GMP-specific phosphodiesterase class I)
VDALFLGRGQAPFGAAAVGEAGQRLVAHDRAQPQLEDLSALPPDVRIAVDDAGAGYDTLARVESLQPGFLKLGRAALAGVEQEGARRAAIRSLVSFAASQGCTVIAEGIESEPQRAALAECGVPLGQGFYLGRPVPAERAVAAAV